MLKSLLILTMIFSFSSAKMFQSVKDNEATFIKTDNTKHYCSSCGMHLGKFYKTNHVHDNAQYCSMHCLVEKNDELNMEEVKVVDTKTLKFINSKDAFYVVGSKKPATMSIQSKYAFSSKTDAHTFIDKNGGELQSFKGALSIAKKDLSKDKAMIQTKREKKTYKTGKKFFNSKCTTIDVTEFKTISELKVGLQKVCETKKDKQLQAISVYLWDIYKLDKKTRTIDPIKVDKHTRCIICGMFVKKYPNWVVSLEMDDGKKYYFDGPKDMLKYVYKHDLKNSEEVKSISVTDYFTRKKVDARKAYFVMGSDVYGPMGKDLVAFEKDKAAYNFKNDHFGKKVMLFEEITDEVLLYLK